MCFWSEIGENSEEMRARFPKGKVKNGALERMMYENENLLCDISATSGSNAIMRDREYAAWFLTEFSDRIFYACDICSQANQFPFELDKFLTSLRESGEISEQTYRRVVRENAVKLLKL